MGDGPSHKGKGEEGEEDEMHLVFELEVQNTGEVKSGLR